MLYVSADEKLRYELEMREKADVLSVIFFMHTW